MALTTTTTIGPAADNTARFEEQAVEKPKARPAKTTKASAATVATGPAPLKPKSKQSTVVDNDDRERGRKASVAAQTKADIVLKKLRSARGATIETLMEVTGWQAHSVRGFLSGTVKKKHGLTLVSEIGKDGMRWYRIDDASRTE